MKNPFESSETFTAYSTMQAAYYQLKTIQEKSMPRGGIIALIDEVTGYQKDIYKQATNEAIEVIGVIIEQKKILEIVYLGDLEVIKKLKSIDFK